MPGLLRCAVYTRKSSEEGLDQAFNSLHAQREACEAYILSQKHEGWSLVPTAYDDGGFSGGTMTRPALQALLADIAAERVNVVVVYKVDRLTRSLADFAKIVEALDAKKAFFVSVTQTFNTTTSMGRLTLNVLLSFAQFEREVTGERIRDKIAASKAKGMWMGGVVPLGYDVKERALAPNPAETAQVQWLFNRYLALGSADALVAEADRLGIRSKRHPASTGVHRGGGRLNRGSLYRLLGNPIYAGDIAHRGKRYPGQHQAIIDRGLWDQVQMQLEENRRKPRGRTRRAVHNLLVGLVQSQDGIRFVPTHSSRGPRRYRYYVGGDRRIPAPALEHLVLDLLKDQLGTPAKLASALMAIGEMAPSRLDEGRVLVGQFAQSDRSMVAAALAEHIQWIAIGEDVIEVQLKPSALGTLQSVTLSAPATVGRRKQRLALLVPGDTSAPPDAALIAIVAQARRWFAALANGEVMSIDELAARDGVGATYISSLLPAAFLAPALVEKIAAGSQGSALTAARLRTLLPLPASWETQRVLIGG